MTTSTHGTVGKKLDIDRLCDAINSQGEPTVRTMLAALREEFPDVCWTLLPGHRLTASVDLDYRP